MTLATTSWSQPFDGTFSSHAVITQHSLQVFYCWFKRRTVLAFRRGTKYLYVFINYCSDTNLIYHPGVICRTKWTLGKKQGVSSRVGASYGDHVVDHRITCDNTDIIKATGEFGSPNMTCPQRSPLSRCLW